MSMPGEFDFSDVHGVWVGATWARSITLLEDDETTPISIAGWDVEFLITDAGGVALLTLTTPISGVVVTTPSTGNMVVTITAAQSTAIGNRNAFYALKLSSGASVIQQLVGRINFVSTL